MIVFVLDFNTMAGNPVMDMVKKTFPDPESLIIVPFGKFSDFADSRVLYITVATSVAYTALNILIEVKMIKAELNLKIPFRYLQRLQRIATMFPLPPSMSS